jgi:hypothetical protein
LRYACAGHIADDVDETSIPITAHNVLSDISDGVWRETVKDFLVGRSFRRDIFVRGPVQLTAAERTKELDRILVLIVPRSVATANIQTPMGEPIFIRLSSIAWLTDRSACRDWSRRLPTQTRPQRLWSRHSAS